MSKLCNSVLEHLVDAADGELSDALSTHVIGCDACRDLVHDVRRAVRELGEAAAGYIAPADLERRVLAAIDARGPVATTTTPTPAETQPQASKDPSRMSTALTDLAYEQRRGVAIALAAATAIGIGAYTLGHNAETNALVAAPWKGTVRTIIGAIDESGLRVVEPNGSEHPLQRGESIAPGSRLRTDLGTRARVELNDGSAITLNRASEVALIASEDRSARIDRGSAVFDVVSSEGAPAQLGLPAGKLSSKGAKLAVALADNEEASVSVAKGTVSIAGGKGAAERVSAGEGIVLASAGAPTFAAAGLAQAFAWSELADDAIDSTVVAQASVVGLGQLRARPPGEKGEGGKPLKLAKQGVKIRVAGEIARTEIEETFFSDEPRVLEGIFRFPLPPDAQIERLALDVDGKLEEGAFVEKDKGAAIWRGVLFNAAPQKVAQRPQEEWIWVPGPWRDPALLEWRPGGRMELRIFPIPAKGSRRVVLAYTQHVTSSAGLRRYVYPLPHLGDGRPLVENFSVDIKVQGHSPSRGVRVRGYETATVDESAVGETQAVTRTMSRTNFVPNGDIVIEYAKKEEGVATTYAYQPPAGGASYVALSLMPDLPRRSDDIAQTHMLIVDSSRSMVGERYARASALAAKVVEELDPRDRFLVLACDVNCTPHALTAATPSKAAADNVRTFLGGITPDGASYLVGAIESAAAMDRSGRAVHVLYIGDGVATIGARSQGGIEGSVRAALGENGRLNAVAVGTDSDTNSLAAMARGGGGTVVPYQAGEKLVVAALNVIEAMYGSTLRDVEIALPQGLDEVAPSRIGSIRAGEETLFVARMSAPIVSGPLTLKGTMAGKPWSTSIPITVRASSDEGNAFVPRVFAATTVGDLERTPGDAQKAKIIELSKTFSVPSRHTSLLVLESPAMALAFGVERRAPMSAWSGDVTATGTTTEGELAKLEKSSGLANMDHADTNGAGFTAGAPRAAATSGPRPDDTSATETPSTKAAPPTMDRAWSMPVLMPSQRRPGRWMRREWYRTVTLGTTAPSDLETKIARARATTLASPDSRDKLAELFGLLAQRDTLSEARDVMAMWAKRDPLDVDATLRRAELIAREGDREAGLRIETGALESRSDDVDLADGLAEVALRAGQPKLACALYAVRAEVRPGDLEGLARQIACLRVAKDRAADDVIANVEPAKRAALQERTARMSANMRDGSSAKASGDLVVDAVWSAGTPTDLDVTIIDPKGMRLSWLSPRAVRVVDPLSSTHEAVGLAKVFDGHYLIEIARVGGSAGPQAGSDVNGVVTIRALGQTRTYPFTLHQNRAPVAHTHESWASRLIPGGGQGDGFWE